MDDSKRNRIRAAYHAGMSSHIRKVIGEHGLSASDLSDLLITIGDSVPDAYDLSHKSHRQC
jgi:hypothetical protein